MVDPMATIEDSLVASLEQLSSACRNSIDDNSALLAAVSSFDGTSTAPQSFLYRDNGMGDPTRYYEDFLSESREFIGVLLTEFACCVCAARRLNDFENTRIF